MQKFIKLIFYLFLAIVTLVGLIVIAVNNFYADKIEKAVLKTINSNIETKINLEKVDFTLFEHFPYAAVKLHNLCINESNKFGNDTLLCAKEVFLDLSIVDVIYKRYNIKRVYLNEGKINIKYNLENEANFVIYKKSDESEKDQNISIKTLLLNNMNVRYQNLYKNTDINWLTNTSSILINDDDIRINADIYSNKLLINKQDYMNKKSCSFVIDSKLAENKFIIKNSNIIIEDVSLEAKGTISNDAILNLKINSNKQNLNSIINNMPEHISRIYNPFVISGSLNGNAEIYGSFKKNTNPHFIMNFSILNGGFNFKSNPFNIENISCSGKINNGEKNNFYTTKIDFSDFYGDTENGNIKGKFTITDLNNMLLDANMISNWDLEKVNHYFQESPFLNMKGSCLLKSNYKGKLAFDNRFRNYFTTSKHESKIMNLDMDFNYINSDLDFNISIEELDIKNNSIQIKESDIEIGSSSMNYSGIIKNFINYFLGKSDEIIIKGNVSSPLILFNELSTITQISNKKSETSIRNLPDWFAANIQIDVENLYYNNFDAKKIKGEIYYDDFKLEGKKITSECLEGILNGEFLLYEPTNKYLVLNTELNLYDIDIRKSFSSFNNFNQSFIKGDELNGIGTIDIDLESHWDKKMDFVDKKFKMKSHLIIEEGELINFKPLENLSAFVDLEDLQHVKFSTLENTIDIRNEIINIPVMEIRSSALSAFISGTHSFKQEIDYNIKLLLSEILSNKLRTNNKDIDSKFGEIKKEDENFTTLYLKMTGSTDDTKVSFDGLRLKEELEKEISTEMEIISEIIKEDVLNLNKEETREPGEDIIIEWEEEKEEKKYLPQ